MRYFRIHADWEELGPYVSAELTDGFVLEEFAEGWTVLPEPEAIARFPEAVAAWRRGDDTVAHRTNDLMRACWDAEEAIG